MKVRFEKCILIPGSGIATDISDLIAELNIYQNLFKHYMEVTAVLRDGINLSDLTVPTPDSQYSGGFTGGEMLIIQYLDEFNVEGTNIFTLYARKNKSRTGNTLETYTLHGISPEAFETVSSKVSKSYGGDAGSDIESMMKNVVGEYIVTKNTDALYSELSNLFKLNLKKPFISDKTNGKHKFVIPNMNIDDTIEFLCNEADSDDHIPQYYFYETQRGFYFKNLSNLVQQNPYMSYVYAEANIDQFDADQKQILDYELVNENDFLDNVNSGLFKSKMLGVDLLRKKLSVREFDYEKYGNSFKKLNNYYIPGKVDSSDASVTMMTTRAGHDFDENLALGLEGQKKIDLFLNARKSYMKHIFSFTLNVTVPGTVFLNVGDTIVLFFPSKESVSASVGDFRYDSHLSGKYIITKVRHKFNDIATDASFVTIMECVKDTEVSEQQLMLQEQNVGL